MNTGIHRILLYSYAGAIRYGGTPSITRMKGKIYGLDIRQFKPFAPRGPIVFKLGSFRKANDFLLSSNIFLKTWDLVCCQAGQQCYLLRQRVNDATAKKFAGQLGISSASYIQ